MRKLGSPIVDRSAKRHADEKTVWSGHEGQCQHEYSGARCAFPGNVHEDGRWLCLSHVEPGNRSPDAEQARFYQRFNPNDVHGVDCITDMLAEWYPRDIDARLQQLVHGNQQWQRQPGEGRTEYNRRMFDNARPLRVGAIKRTKEAGGAA